MKKKLLNRNRCYLYLIVFLYSVFFVLSSIASDKIKMKILMVVPTFPKIHDICMLNQMTGLIDRGHEVYINALRLGDTLKMQKDVIKYNLLSKTIIGGLPKDLNKYDIVMFQLGHKAVNIKKTHHYKGKVVICLRGYDITAFIKNNEHAYDDYFETCDLFLPVCEVFKKRIESLGCSPDKVIVQHSGIDCSQFTFKERTFPHNGRLNIVSVGRFVEKKGFIYSLRAIAQLLKKYPRIHYTIIGDGILKTQYMNYIKKMGIENNVSIKRWHTHKKYIAMLNRFHISIVPSVVAHNNDEEGIPNVLKEAMAVGLIPIATNHSGNSELIKDNISGFLVPEKSRNAIVSAVSYIIENPDKWRSIQAEAHNLVNISFDTEKENDKLEKILLTLVAK